jgi:nitrogen fixation protein FixH
MTLLETLFGGPVLIAVLYFGLRLLRVQNYWRGVISGIVPLVAYIVYASRYWPGGEVVSMHIAVYLATATVLTLLGSRNAAEKTPMHWIPKTIVTFFLVLFVIQGTLMYISTRGVPLSVASWMFPRAESAKVHTAFPGVVAHGEDAAKTVAQHMKRMERQRELQWHVEISGLATLRQNVDGEVRVELRDKLLKPIDGATVAFNLLRPATAEEDQNGIVLQPAGPGLYSARVQPRDAGLWVAMVTIAYGGDTLETTQNIRVPRTE